MQMMHQYYASAGPPRPGGAQGPQVMGGYPAYAYHQQVAKQPSGAYPPGYAYHPHMGHFAASGAKSSSYEAFMDHYAQHCSNGAQRVSVEKSNSPDEPSSKSGEAKPKDNASGSPTEETPSNCRPEETQKTKQWWKDPAQVWGPPGTVPEQTASPKLSRKSHPSAGKPWETATMSGPAKLAMKRR